VEESTTSSANLGCCLCYCPRLVHRGREGRRSASSPSQQDAPWRT
jgi:hypothetical protein